MARWWTSAVTVVFLMAAGPIWAAPMQVMESRPAASAVMDGADTEFFVRFDGPVDHAASQFAIVQAGRVVQALTPRLNSQPNTLYGGVRRLAPGSYTLRWSTRSMHDHEVAQGEIAFTVR